MRWKGFLAVLALLAVLPASGEDLATPGRDAGTLQTQLQSLNVMIQNLQACLDQPGSEFKKSICRRALQQQNRSKDILQKKLDLVTLKESPDLLPENLKKEAEQELVKLDREYEANSQGSPGDPSPPPAPAASEGGSKAAAALPAASTAPAGGQQAANSRAPGTQPQPSPRPYCGKSGASPCGGQLLRSIVGFEQAGASAANSRQSFFFDLYLSRPIRYSRKIRTTRDDAATGKDDKEDIDLGPRWRSWGDLRITSVPQQINSSVATFAATFAQTVGELKVNQVAQSFEFLGGLDYRLFQSPGVFAAFDKDTTQRFSLNLIAGGGVITPITPLESVQIFKVPTNQPDFLLLFPQATGKQFVAFTLPDRNRFFRQAYAGIRLMTHFIEDKTENPKPRFPATFDLTYGFNESVTGGRIHGGVVRLEGFVPVPYSRASWIYLFGTGMFKPGAHAQVRTPFLLDQAPPGTLPTDPNAVVITTPQTDRDYYRIGVGIDLIDLVRTYKKPTDNGSSSQGNNAGGASDRSKKQPSD